MAKRTHSYIKLNEDMSVKYCPRNDVDGSVTGHIVYEVAAWFDENPEERKKLGWIKIRHSIWSGQQSRWMNGRSGKSFIRSTSQKR